MFCPKCKMEVESVVKEIEETYPVKGEDTSITARVRFCAVCGEEIWDDELDSQNLLNAYVKYRENHGLLQPEEIHRIREQYGLSQIEFARVLGLKDDAIARYERGTIAETAHNYLIALMRYPENFERLIGQKVV